MINNTQQKNGILEQIRRDILGESVSGLGASGFLTVSSITRLIEHLRSTIADRFLDVGCGNGKLGVHIASMLGCRDYLGFDANSLLIENARSTDVIRRISVCFEVATFERPPISTEWSSASVALAHDSLYLADDLSMALRGIHTLVAPGGSLLLTAYIGRGVNEGGVQGRMEDDWGKALAAAGFKIEGLEDVSAEWRDVGQRLHSARLAAAAEVLHELGTNVGSQALWISRRMLGLDGRVPFLRAARRIEIIACA